MLSKEDEHITVTNNRHICKQTGSSQHWGEQTFENTVA